MTAPREKTEARKLPMMPIRDMVIFPYMMTPFVAVSYTHLPFAAHWLYVES